MAKNKKGLNKDKTNDLLKDVEQVLETNGHITKDEIDALANQEITVEDVTKIAEKNAIDISELQSEVEEQYQNSLNDREEEIDMNLQILNAQIKQAIAFNKDKSRKGISGGQYKTVLVAYEKFTGVQMSEEQSEYIKKINFEQARAVIYTLNEYNKYIKSLNQQQLAGATN